MCILNDLELLMSPQEEAPVDDNRVMTGLEGGRLECDSREQIEAGWAEM